MSQIDENIRYGGAANETDGEDAQRKAQEREAKKAEVRKRLEEAGQKKQKKGFLTPERKKKLRKLLMNKAAEDLKTQQLRKEQERVKVLAERTVALPNVDSIDDHAKLEAIYNDLFSRLCNLEEEKYDINHITTETETTINQLNIEVNDLRGKFVKPSLKKVSKYDNKFKKMAEAKKEDGSKNLRNNLKTVKKESVFTQIANKKKSDKPEWSKKKEEKKEESAPEPVIEPVEEEETAASEGEEEEEEADEE
ncbi:Troponin I 1 [Caenorhabditis elegans]|uniref:Troponin I 1 n=1 Tax=Caenorhabditis elegans TaxID=6239 RepID=TNNI1_CAEEL|nr:Troponin I 1 [Caenorhabditis elegans]Q20334.1 RecName: Full=Troponin I 1; Short=CeTNI-1; Short=TnI 1 [Caenorhabditis elegans]BAD89379.1 troponin I 1 [Caenorhabditis elegans]CAA91466.1 Troponin I 1 [Caenorhabditis elegans]|eukprot:NP_509906.1 Troponin I 1 [Caenorhabditis elegans]